MARTTLPKAACNERVTVGLTRAYALGSKLTSTTDALGQRRDISYDALNRETGETWTVGGSVVNTLTYTFDAANNLFSAGDANGTYTFTLDGLNRQRAQQGPFDTTLTMSYDAASNQVQVLDNFGGTTSSSYDALNRLTSRGLSTTGGVALHEALTWTAQNLLATVSRYDDEGTSTLVGTSSYGYDTASRLTQIWHASGSGTVLASYVYSFDAGSRVTQQVVDGTSTTFSYDQASQLTQAGSATYGYDPTGNRTNTGYATGAGNQMTNDGTWTYTYDAKGQLIEKSMGPSAETWYYGYNLRGQMTWAEDEATPGGTLISLSSYVYDVFGNRIEEDVWTAASGTTTVSRQAYLGSNAWADLDASDALVDRHLFLDGANQVFAAVTASGTVTWDLADRLGSVTDVVNFAGTTDLDRVTFDAYGNITGETDAAAGDVYKYDGGRYDVPTGLTLFGWRYYDAAAGRWTTPDLSGFAGGDVNESRYAGNDPTNATDTNGLIWSFFVTGAFFVNDAYQWSRGNISPREFALRTAVNLVVVAIDIGTGGGSTGFGQLFRVGGGGALIGFRGLTLAQQARIAAVAVTQTTVRAHGAENMANATDTLVTSLTERAIQRSSRLYAANVKGDAAGSAGGGADSVSAGNAPQNSNASQDLTTLA